MWADIDILSFAFDVKVGLSLRICLEYPSTFMFCGSKTTRHCQWRLCRGAWIVKKVVEPIS